VCRDVFSGHKGYLVGNKRIPKHTNVDLGKAENLLRQSGYYLCYFCTFEDWISKR